MSQLVTVPRVLVQTALALPAADAGWTTHPWARFVGGSEGCLPTLGDAAVEVPAGVLLPEGGSTYESVAFGNAIGRVVRILKEDTTGSVQFRGKRFAPFWHGQFINQTSEPDGGTGLRAGGRVTLNAVGLLSLLDQVTLVDGYVKVGSSALPIGFVPPLNDDAWPRSSSTITAASGASVYVWDPSITTAQKWTAAQFVNYLLAVYAPSSFGSWQISGLTSALDYQPERRDWSGASLLQALMGMIDAQRGITARVEVSGRTISLVIRTGTPSALSLGSYTLPANTDQVTATATVARLAGVALQEDYSSRYGTVIARGERPLVGLTGAYAGAAGDMFGKGWDTGTEASWLSDPKSYPDTFRRFVVQSTWAGTDFAGTAALHGTLTTATSADYGAGGLTGARSSGGYGSGGIPGNIVELIPRIPSDVLKGKWGKPTIIVKKDSTYLDKTKDWNLDIEEYPPAIRIDDGDEGRLLRAFLTSGWSLLVTVGVREVHPLAASYIESLDKRKAVDLRGIELWRIVAGTRTGGTTTHAGGTIRDDTDQLRQTLPVLRARYLESDWSFDLTDMGVLDVDLTTGAPGQLVTSVDRGDQALTPNVVITRRAWRLSRAAGGERWDTTFGAHRVRPDEGAIR